MLPINVFLTNGDKMSNLFRGPSKDGFYEISVHLGKRFQRRIFFLEIIKSETRMPIAEMFVNGSELNYQSL
jgi:hypothetical protein